MTVRRRIHKFSSPGRIRTAAVDIGGIGCNLLLYVKTGNENLPKQGMF
jgi:hypothetical protein